jgi:hypothetical protein
VVCHQTVVASSEASSTGMALHEDRLPAQCAWRRPLHLHLAE